MSLVLVAGNTAPPSVPASYRPGHRQSLAAGTCQKCLMASPGVRTVGVRRRGELHFKKLALCPGCVALAREQGYPVIS
jgi:hypothetical protein